jgi:hypothetical protein
VCLLASAAVRWLQSELDDQLETVYSKHCSAVRDQATGRHDIERKVVVSTAPARASDWLSSTTSTTAAGTN